MIPKCSINNTSDLEQLSNILSNKVKVECTMDNLNNLNIDVTLPKVNQILDFNINIKCN